LELRSGFFKRLSLIFHYNRREIKERGACRLLIEFITKYWLEVLFTLICSGAAWLARNYVRLAIADKKRHEKDIIDALEKKMDEQKTGMKE
jgi:hypothetical protein